LEGVSRNTSFISRVALITGANFLSFALATATPFIVANLLSPAQVGLYKQAFLIVTIVTSILNMQVASGGYYFIPHMPEKRFQIAVNILLFYFLAGSVVAVLFLFYPQWWGIIFSSPDIIQHIPTVGIIILLWLMSATLELLPLALGDARTAAVFIILSQLSRSCLIIGATILFRNERAIIRSSVVQCAFQLALVFWYLWRRYRPWRNPLDWPLFKAQMANAIPYGAGNVIFYLQGQLHNLFISHFFAPAVFAVYSVGCFQLTFLSPLTDSFSAMMFPEIARLGAGKDYQRIIAIWSDSMRKLALAFIPACILLFILRHDFFAFLFPRAYAGASSIFAIYLLCVLMTMPQTEPILRAFADLKYFRLKIYIFLLPLSFMALFAGVKIGGLIGVIVVTVIVQALDLSITLRFISRRIGFTGGDLKALTPMPWTALAGLLAGAAIYCARGFMSRILPDEIIAVTRMFAAFNLMICGVLYLVIYLISAFALGAITESEIKELAPALGKLRRFVPASLWRVASDSLASRKEMRLEKGTQE